MTNAESRSTIAGRVPSDAARSLSHGVAGLLTMALVPVSALGTEGPPAPARSAIVLESIDLGATWRERRDLDPSAWARVNPTSAATPQQVGLRWHTAIETPAERFLNSCRVEWPRWDWLQPMAVLGPLGGRTVVLGRRRLWTLDPLAVGTEDVAPLGVSFEPSSIGWDAHVGLLTRDSLIVATEKSIHRAELDGLRWSTAVLPEEVNPVIDLANDGENALALTWDVMYRFGYARVWSCMAGTDEWRLRWQSGEPIAAREVAASARMLAVGGYALRRGPAAELPSDAARACKSQDKETIADLLLVEPGRPDRRIDLLGHEVHELEFDEHGRLFATTDLGFFVVEDGPLAGTRVTAVLRGQDTAPRPSVAWPPRRSSSADHAGMPPPPRWWISASRPNELVVVDRERATFTSVDDGVSWSKISDLSTDPSLEWWQETDGALLGLSAPSDVPGKSSPGMVRFVDRGAGREGMRWPFVDGWMRPIRVAGESSNDLLILGERRLWALPLGSVLLDLVVPLGERFDTIIGTATHGMTDGRVAYVASPIGVAWTNDGARHWSCSSIPGVRTLASDRSSRCVVAVASHERKQEGDVDLLSTPWGSSEWSRIGPPGTLREPLCLDVSRGRVVALAQGSNGESGSLVAVEWDDGIEVARVNVEGRVPSCIRIDAAGRIVVATDAGLWRSTTRTPGTWRRLTP